MIENDAVKTLSEQWPGVAAVATIFGGVIIYLFRKLMTNHDQERTTWTQALDKIVHSNETSLQALGNKISDEMDRNRKTSEEAIRMLLKKR